MMVFNLFASASQASYVISEYLAPILKMLGVLGAVVAVAMLVIGGFNYATSSDDPNKLDRAKTIIKRALIGLTIVLAASTLGSMLSHAYSETTVKPQQIAVALQDQEIEERIPAVARVIIEGITGFVRVIVTSLGQPILKTLDFFIGSTPLAATSQPVFNMWLIVLAIANALFILLIVIIGFHVMSSSALGFEDMDLRQLLPRLALTFVLMNSSIFLIDMLIELSNTLIKALEAGIHTTSLWTTLERLFFESTLSGVAVMLIMVALIIMAVILLVYYLGRIVTIYLGAILAPLVILIGVLPSFRDFSLMLARSYVVTIFILFVHNVIAKLAAGVMLGGYMTGNGDVLPMLLPLAIGIAALLAMLRVEGVVSQFATAAIAPRAMKNMSRQFVRSSKNFVGGTKSFAKSETANNAVKTGATAVKNGAVATSNTARKGAVVAATAAVLGTASPMVTSNRQTTKNQSTPIARQLKDSGKPTPKTIKRGKKDA